MLYYGRRALAPGTSRLEQALGCVLAEDVRADADSPPFDKALVDGYAVRTADLEGTEPSLTIGELITAGRMPIAAAAPARSCRDHDGRPIPAGCDAVVMQERTRSADGVVIIEQTPIRPGQNVLRRGAEMRAGEMVLARGSVLHPAQLGVLASVGRTEVQVVPAAAGLDRADRRRAGRARRNPRAGSNPQLERGHASCAWQPNRARWPTRLRSRRTSPRELARILDAGARGRPRAGDRRRIGRPARSGAGCARGARGAAGSSTRSA